MSDGFRSLVYGTVLALAIGGVLYIGRDIFVPIVFSVLVVYVIAGVSSLLSRIPGLGRRVPASVNWALSTLLIVLALAATFSLAVVYLSRIVEIAPQYQDSLLATIQAGAARLGIEAQPTWATVRGALLGQINPQALVASAVSLMTAAASSLIVVVLYVAFLLIERRTMADKLANLSDDPQRVAQLQRIITHINTRVGTYLALKTVVCAVTGCVSFVIMYLVGLEFAAFWGLLIAFLNYVPYLGSWLSVIFPVSWGLLQFGYSPSLIALLIGLVVAQFLLGNLLDPYLMASSLNLSPFAILVSLTVWTALWGIPGAFLAVPLTACIAMILAEFKGTRPITVLLSRAGRLEEH